MIEINDISKVFRTSEVETRSVKSCKPECRRR